MKVMYYTLLLAEKAETETDKLVALEVTMAAAVVVMVQLIMDLLVLAAAEAVALLVLQLLMVHSLNILEMNLMKKD